MKKILFLALLLAGGLRAQLNVVTGPNGEIYYRKSNDRVLTSAVIAVDGNGNTVGGMTETTLAPSTGFTGRTLTANTNWQSVAMSGTITGQINMVIFNNNGPGVLFWWIDYSLSVPAFAGFPLLNADRPIEKDGLKNTAVFHWRTSDGSTTGFLANWF